MSSEQQDEYYLKYLKYKLKYLELTEQAGGLLTLNSGVYAFFCNKNEADSICAAVYKASPSNAKINQVLSKAGVAYRGKQGDSKITLVSESSFRKGLAKTQVGLKKAAMSTGSAIYSGAKKTGSFLSSSASSLKTKVSEKMAQMKAKKEASKSKPVFLDDVPDDGPPQPIDDKPIQSGGDDIKEFALRTPLDISKTTDLLETLKKINNKFSNVNTVVVVEIRRAGENKCLNRITL
jgi:hypothetical protein